jgi:hypothetical protein
MASPLKPPSLVGGGGKGPDRAVYFRLGRGHWLSGFGDDQARQIIALSFDRPRDLLQELRPSKRRLAAGDVVSLVRPAKDLLELRLIPHRHLRDDLAGERVSNGKCVRHDSTS